VFGLALSPIPKENEARAKQATQNHSENKQAKMNHQASKHSQQTKQAAAEDQQKQSSQKHISQDMDGGHADASQQRTCSAQMQHNSGDKSNLP
jgi:hypothetical protein